jgi:multicomponent Na+:H+ antiporter subunit D
MMLNHLPILQVVVPFVAAPICLLIGNRRLVYLFALIAAWATFAISVALMGQVLQQGVLYYHIGNWAPPYGIEYVVDPLNALVALFVSGIGAIVLTYASKSIAMDIPESKQTFFYSMFLVCKTGLLGMALTGDLFNVFVFLEISSLSTYALISMGKNRRAPLASLQYLIMGTIGATFFLIGVGLLYQMTGTLNMLDIARRLEELAHVNEQGVLVFQSTRTLRVALAFMTVGLAIKMAVFPVHNWLPNAYTYAPNVVTSFLAATASKVSVYALIRLIYSVFTVQFTYDLLPMRFELIVLSLVGIFAASLAAIYQTNVKKLLAYSSVAQLGYMVLGVNLINPNGLSGAIVHLFNHAIIKGALFMVVGCFAYRIGSVQLDDWRGAGRKMPLTSFAWVCGGLGLIGVPLTAGFVSKWMLLMAFVEGENWILAGSMLFSSLLAVVYTWRVVETLYFSEPSAKVREMQGVPEAPWSMLLPTYALIVAIFVFGCWKFAADVATRAAMMLLGGAAE